MPTAVMDDEIPIPAAGIHARQEGIYYLDRGKPRRLRPMHRAST